MGYTAEELRDLEHPYEDLGTGDALAENMAELNSLSPEDQKSLAARLILACPQSELKAFRSQIEAARTPHDDKQTFHAVLSEAYEIKNRILALLDLRNTKPHQLILGNEFNEKLFHNHRQLAIDVLQDNETSIAERLALTTPPENRNQLTLNVRGIFPDSLLAKKIGHAFAIRRDIDNLLLGAEPHQFFASREYNEDACHEFAGLFSTISGHESSIAAKLALTVPKEERSGILRNISGLISAKDELSRKVSAAFELRRTIELTLLGDKPEQFFSRGFSADLCNEYSVLFSTLIKSKEAAIGEKLSQLDEGTRADINRKLEQINSAAHEQSSPFRLIAEAMTPKQDAVQSTSAELPKPESVVASCGTNPNSLFSVSPELTQRKSLLSGTPITADNTGPGDSNDDGCIKKFCGMFG
ncbi:hypothetical protein [uncultured Legionella sp.]|uniref:hypothetical protein n=1 Tax=uncultured Legionella sp. TaxID=210934 RepID=UPI0026399583|nr:hypothetical protein [uncultured Legionella sp.]